MSNLFESTTINGMPLKNRFVRSATFEAMAEKSGVCTQLLVDLLRDLAVGDVGLIITGFAYVNLKGQSRPLQTGIHTDEMIPGLTRLTAAVHDVGGTIAMQIAHTGCNSFVMPPGENSLAPSPMKMPQGVESRAMTKDEVLQTIDDFVNAAVRVKKAGFDGVQLHGAHGYLISQFLSPYYNKRNDEFGGSLENRSRFLMEILRGIRKEVGDDYPVMIKINSDDGLEGGFNVQEMLQVCFMMEKEGIDAIEVSGGTHLSPNEYSFSRVTGPVPEEKELYFAEAAKLYREKIGVPLMLVGGIRSIGVAEKVVNDDLADYISICRPLIREPHLISRWKSGDRKKSTCISCNECFEPVRTDNPLYCVTDAKIQK